MEDPNKSETLMWVPEMSPSIVARRLRNAASMQSARARETPGACAVRREQNAARMEVLRGQESEERAAERRAKNAAAMQAARARETPQQAAARRAQNAARMVALRARETPEQRSARRSSNAARMQATRAKDALQETAKNVGMDVLMEDDVMRRAMLAAHRSHSQPPKKRKDREILVMDLDRQDGQTQHVVQRAEAATACPPHPHENGHKFSFAVD